MDSSLYQILKSIIYELASQVKRPWKGMGWGYNFCKKKIEKNVWNLATVAANLHRKTAKLLIMALNLPILKILQIYKKYYIYQYSTGGHFFFYFCF